MDDNNLNIYGDHRRRHRRRRCRRVKYFVGFRWNLCGERWKSEWDVPLCNIFLAICGAVFWSACGCQCLSESREKDAECWKLFWTTPLPNRKCSSLSKRYEAHKKNEKRRTRMIITIKMYLRHIAFKTFFMWQSNFPRATNMIFNYLFDH